MKRRSVLQAIGGGHGLIVAAGLAGCTGRVASTEQSTNTTGTSIEMTIDDVFEPAAVTISTGDRVVWRNVGIAGQDVLTSTHTVTADETRLPEGATYFASGDFTSEQAAREGYVAEERGGIEGGQEYSHTFDVPGRYEYYCIPHESTMRGSITVE
ncbi:hypothetical protein C2R22_15255 [Salinigranum rubrum]|uniref:Blue (type 1) copper domain-containing protein n=2 Tax=Salinigranum rubrum TaxID=755307 RepID=A0A2I8VLL5_9EURY|nr:hypothetical protein C2R22_15255 [Salinigranum rubrum]